MLKGAREIIRTTVNVLRFGVVFCDNDSFKMSVCASLVFKVTVNIHMVKTILHRAHTLNNIALINWFKIR